ncbi:MAG: hypothetical protein HQ541_00520, partial [Mariniphaga sp.]|nr:hypothetical protein [Mariniphaga sp.]
MKSKSQIININNKIPTLIMVFLVVLFFGCNNKKSKTGNSKILFEHEEKIGTERAEEIAVEKPPFSEGIFPCNECHSYMDSNPIRRELVDMHDEISANFTHDNENRWCLDCH